MGLLVKVCMVVGVLLSTALHAQESPDLRVVAEMQGACVPFGVASARLGGDGTIRVVCNADATAFAPLLGGLGPALGAGAAAMAVAAISNGNATPDTQ